MMIIKVMINNALIESKRKELRYTNKDLALALGYKTEAAVRRKIKGERNWSASDIQKLTEIFDVTYEDLYSE